MREFRPPQLVQADSRRPTIKVQDLDGLAINLIQGSQSRQRQAVITAQSHQPGLGRQRRCRLPPAELLEGLGHLLPGDVVVKGGDADVAAVDDLGPVLVGVDAGARVEAAERRLARRGGADGAGAEACARPVADGRVKGGTDDGDVEGLGGLGEALDVVQVGKGVDASKGPLFGRVSVVEEFLTGPVPMRNTYLIAPFRLELIQLLLGPFLVVMVMSAG